VENVEKKVAVKEKGEKGKEKRIFVPLDLPK